VSAYFAAVVSVYPEVSRAESSILACRGLLRSRKEDDRIGIHRNVGAELAPVAVTMLHADRDAAGRIGISRSISVLAGNRGANALRWRLWVVASYRNVPKCRAVSVRCGRISIPILRVIPMYSVRAVESLRDIPMYSLRAAGRPTALP
jgi:hypothetical protein